MLNKVQLIGHVGQAPQVKTMESGAKVALLSLATSENYKDKNDEWQQKTEWHRVIAWNYLAEKAEKQLKKGSKVYVEGVLTTREWFKDDEKRHTTEVVAKTILLLDKKDSDTGYMPTENDEPHYTNKTATALTNEEADIIGKDKEDNIPF